MGQDKGQSSSKGEQQSALSEVEWPRKASQNDIKAETWKQARHFRKRSGVSGIEEGCTKPWVVVYLVRWVKVIAIELMLGVHCLRHEQPVWFSSSLLSVGMEVISAHF